MFKQIICKVFRLAGGLSGAALLGLILLSGATALASPVNDYFTNATVISGTTGTTNGSNIGATFEFDEPVDAGVGGGKSIWYVWTAPSSGTIIFNTEGSDFDTVMGVYTGTNVTNLTLVAQNDDVAFPGDLTSQVTFPVVQGTNYYISVDGNEGDSGNVILSWVPSGAYSAGSIIFASGGLANLDQTQFKNAGLYIVSPTEDTLSRAESAVAAINYMIPPGSRAHLARTGGTSGQINVTYSLTNAFYTNILITNYQSINVFSTNSDGSGTTNSFMTNTVVLTLVQNYYAQQFLYTAIITNAYQTVIGMTNNGPVTGYTNLDISTNIPTLMCGALTNSTNFITNGAVITAIYSNVVCSPTIISSNRVPAATAITAQNPNGDYTPIVSNTVGLIDFQLLQDIAYNVANGTAPPDNVAAISPLRLVNRLLVFTINSVSLAPNEDQTLAPPTIGMTNALVEIVNQHVAIDNVSQGSTNGIANFTKSVTWVQEIPSAAPLVAGTTNQWTVQVFAHRSGTNLTTPLTLNYTADQAAPLPGGEMDAYHTFPLQPGSDYATPPNADPQSGLMPHFVPQQGTVSWSGPNDLDDKPINIIVNYDPAVQFNEDILVQLYDTAGDGQSVGLLNTETLTILFNDQPAGALDELHNQNNVKTTVPPFNQSPGAGGSNNTVYAAVVQPDNKTIFSGDFTSYNTTPRNRVARMNADGSLDTTFMAVPNSGANNVVSCLALQPDGKVIIGGVFTSFNATNRYHIARLNSDGSLDTTFNTGIGMNNSVWALALQTDGRVVVGGSFTSVNGTNCNYIARLNTNGSLDTTFNAGTGPNATINALALQSDGRIVIGGQFTTVDLTNFSYIARLNADGSLDTSFAPGTGADQPVYALAEQTDGNIVVGGAFNNINYTSRSKIARLSSNGAIDLTFDPGTGADDVIYTLAIQPDGNILAGGLFTSYNSTRRIGITRILTDGTVDTSFMDTAYNQFAGLVNTINNQNVQSKNYLFTIALQTDGNIIIGGRFSQLGGGYDYVNRSGLPSRESLNPRQNIARLIGNSTPGPGNIGFTYSSYTGDKDGGPLYVTMQRLNGHLGVASVNLQDNPLHNGAGVAVPNQDFIQAVTAITYISPYSVSAWMVSDAVAGQNYDARFYFYNSNNFVYTTIPAYVDIIDNPNSSGNLALNLQLTQPTGSLTLGGEPISLGVALGTAQAPLTIIDDTIPAGTLEFSQALFYANQNGTNAVITVIRTNGNVGPVTVKYFTTPGTAFPGATNDYVAVSGTLTFNSGEIIKTFTIPLINSSLVGPDRSLTVGLTNVTGGGLLGSPSTATVTIINDNFAAGHMTFDATNYSAQENSGSVTLNVIRLGGSLGTETVTYATTNGSAVNTLDYVGTNGVLTFNSGDTTPKTITVKLLNSGLVSTNLSFHVLLSNGLVNGVANTNALEAPTNALVTISNNNSYGSPTLSASNYVVNENAGYVVVTVNRLGGSSQTISVDYATSDGTASSVAVPSDYSPVSGTLTFTNGQFSQSFIVPIVNNGNGVETNNGVYFNVTLSNPQPAQGPNGSGVVLGTPSTATVTIIADQVVNQPPGQLDTTFNSTAGFNGTVYSLVLQPDGSFVAGGDFTQANGIGRNRIARLNGNGILDTKFTSGSGGADNSIRALLLQTSTNTLLNNAIVVGGLFDTFNGVNEKYIARINTDGSLDSSFDTGTGFDNPVYALGEYYPGGVVTEANRKIVAGGSFASIDGVSYRGIARLNNNGTVDTSFNALGVNGTVYAVAVYSTNDVNSGKILIGGDFTTVNGTNVDRVARLNADGSLDTSFNVFTDTNSGPNASVRALAIQLDGKVLIGGLFTAVNGTNLNYIARLDAFGAVDPGFNVGLGANDAVTAIAIQQDLNIVVGGSFTEASGVTRNRLTRLNSDGTVDATINFGSGANDFIDAIVIQPDAKILVGGGFTEFDGASKLRLARIYGGSEIGSGEVEFTSGNYQVNQVVTNLVISVTRVGGTGYSGPDGGYSGPVSVIASTSDGTGTAGVDYVGVTNVLTFQEGETFQSFTVPILLDPTNRGTVTVNLTLSDPSNGDPSTFAVLGNQSTATISIIGANSTVSFSAANYSVSKNTTTGGAVFTVNRNYSRVGAASVDFSTTLTGTATPGTDFTAVSNTVFFADGQSNASVTIPIINNGLPEGNVTVGFILSNPTNTVLDTTLPTSGTLTIIDNNNAPGNLEFSAASYSVSQTATNAIITVIRTNGNVGQISATYSTGGGTATAGTDYVATNGTITFLDGETSKTFSIPILDNTNLVNDVVVNLTLSNPSGGAQILSPATGPLTIQNANFDISFAQAGYFVDEKNGNVVVGVNRTGSTNGTLYVNYATTNGTALAGVNYLTATGTLTFPPGQTFQTFTVPILYDSAITGNLVFFVGLSSTNASSFRIIAPTVTTVTVLDDDSGFALGSNTTSIVKGNTNAFVSVLRLGNTGGAATVNYATTGGTAATNVEYVPVSGTLTFANGVISNAFAIPILNDNQIDGNQTVNYALSSPTAGSQLLSPSTGVLTIFDNESAFSFSSANYSVNENGISATITVVRTGVTNSTVTVNYATSDGSAHAGSQYIAASGTLTFTNGQTSATFTVPIIDNNVTGGSETVILVLSSPSATATLVNPTAATLTILNNDGSLIVPAGSAVLVPTNSVISSGSNVTVLLSLRNTAGSDATNVVATLLSTNGVTATGTTNQNYGTLYLNGASVFRPFTFIASGTNGAKISAVLQLHFDTTNTQLVSFTYTLGTSTNFYTNNALITINDNAAASPYPSVITVSSLVGQISKVTATVSNLGHAYVSDVSMLLVGPAGQKELLMEQTGGAHTITNVTLTFDSTATTSLTTNAPTSGTYLPSPLQTGLTFHTSTNGIAPPSVPYSENLGDFIGTNPNGAWSLYVDDAKYLDTGAIKNGWVLAINLLNVVTPNVDLIVGLSASPSQIVVSNSLSYVIAVTNAGPSSATGVNLTNVFPAGLQVTGITVSQGSFSTNSGNLICSLGTLATNGVATVTITAIPTTTGTYLDTASVGANETENNPANNTAQLTLTVGNAVADLALGVVGTPNPVLLANNLTYAISVTNWGPALTTGVYVTNTLPTGAVFVSSTASGGYGLTNGVYTFNVGTISNGAVNTFNMVVRFARATTLTNSFGVTSALPDPLKGNNIATIKTIVQAVPLSLTHSPTNFLFSWPASGSNYLLQTAPTLPTTNWVTVTNYAIVVANGSNTISIPTSTGMKFFRLISH